MSVVYASDYLKSLSLDDDMQRDACFLLADILQKPAGSLMWDATAQIGNEQRKLFKAGLTKLQNGIPLAYVLGNQPFWTLEFLVNEHTLIPRDDTQVIVEQALSLGDKLCGILSQDKLSVLDLGTGSGIIAICLKHERPIWQVTATDFSDEALKVASKNASNNQVDITFLQGSWFEAVPAEKKYHLIVSNPPYIAPDDEHLAALKYEPQSALVADNAGMADIMQIIEAAPKYMHEGGWLLIEHGYNQGAPVREYFIKNGFTSVKTITDLGGNARVTLGIFNTNPI